MKVEFPLWLVTNPDRSEGLSDICKHFTNFGEMEHFVETTMCPNGALYTTEAEATADAQARLDARDGKGEWVLLSELRPGAVFETQVGIRAVKSEYSYNNHGACACTLLASGEAAHFAQHIQDPREQARAHNATLVREIPV